MLSGSLSAVVVFVGKGKNSWSLSTHFKNWSTPNQIRSRQEFDLQYIEVVQADMAMGQWLMGVWFIRPMWLVNEPW